MFKVTLPSMYTTRSSGSDDKTSREDVLRHGQVQGCVISFHSSSVHFFLLLGSHVCLNFQDGLFCIQADIPTFHGTNCTHTYHISSHVTLGMTKSELARKKYINIYINIWLFATTKMTIRFGKSVHALYETLAKPTLYNTHPPNCSIYGTTHT